MDHPTMRRWRRAPWAALAAVVLVASAQPALAGVHPDADTGGPTSATTAVQAPVTSDVLGPETAARSAARPDRAGPAGGEAAVAEYWTAERMDRAIPADLPRTGDRTDTAGADGQASLRAPAEAAAEAEEATQPSSITAEPVPALDAAADPQVDPVTNYSRTNGKVFFRDQSDGLDYACSGSALNSSSKRLVVTAGHCVHGGPGGTWHANWVFVPGYHRGQQPAGAYQALTFRTFDDWIANGGTGRGFNSDVAFVTTRPNAKGQTVVDAVGGHGLWNGGGYVFDASLFGYPGNLDSGEVMWACWGSTQTRTVDNFLFVSISGCNFGGGSSGGPWLYQYSNATGLGYVRSVTSFGPSDSTAYIAGPYFDQRVTDMYYLANGDWSG
jgi:V8-like Glu-specific endopeptidase